MTMFNFTAADMPGGTKAKSKKAEPEVEAPVEETPKEKPATKKPANKKAAPKKEAEPIAEEPQAPEQTDTETHGVGPSTVEGAAVSDETNEALAESVGVEAPEESN